MYISEDVIDYNLTAVEEAVIFYLKQKLFSISMGCIYSYFFFKFLLISRYSLVLTRKIH